MCIFLQKTKGILNMLYYKYRRRIQSKKIVYLPKKLFVLTVILKQNKKK